MAAWTFLTKHAQALLQIARNPEIRLRDVAAALDITERSAQGLVRDLADEGYVEKRRIGRRNVYKVRPQLPFRTPAISHRQIGELLDLLAAPTQES